MLRHGLLAVAATAMLSGALRAQNYTGTWTAQTPNGGTLTLQLQQDARGQVTGSLSGNGTMLQVQAQVQQGQVVGYARNQQGAVVLQAQLTNGGLTVALAEAGPNGQAQGQAQQIMMTAAAGAGQQMMGGAMGQQPQMGQQQMGGMRPSAGADPFVGTFTGGDLTIQLQRNGQGYVGVARSAGGQYQVQAQVQNGVMTGMYMDRGMQRTFQAAVQGDVMQLQADGTQFMLQRQGGQMAGGQMGGMQQGQQGGMQMGGGQMGAGAVASSAQDQQIAQFLMGNRWCSFSYSQISGRTDTEQVQFFPDGTVTQGAQHETQSSNPNGQYYGNSQGGQRGRWRIQNGQLMLSQDGMQWQPMPIQVTRNSNGSPIVNSGGKEYMVC